jgi:nitrogen fixation protein NifT
MKVTLRRVADYYEIYVPKKDLEEKIVEMEGDSPWGGVIKISNGWTFQMPDMPADTPLPITVEARKLGGDD